MDRAWLHLHGDLAELARRRDGPVVAVPVAHPRSVKDAVESVGVPHTEVGAVRVGGAEVDWTARLVGGEQVAVHPVGRAPSDLAGRVRPPAPPDPVRVVADVHLGTLARRLRVLGVDTWWRNDVDDAALADVAVDEGRVLLTRDRGLLMRRAVEHGVLVRDDDPDAQLVQVVDRLGLQGRTRPGRRCPRCNGRVVPVARSEVVERLEPGTRAAGYRRFGRCRDCAQLYWAGAHADAIRAITDRARPAVRP
jgi:uncharacterized protein with PIN domain